MYSVQYSVRFSVQYNVLYSTVQYITLYRMTGELFHAGPGLAGTMTSGGTESLILAVLAYR